MVLFLGSKSWAGSTFLKKTPNVPAVSFAVKCDPSWYHDIMISCFMLIHGLSVGISLAFRWHFVGISLIRHYKGNLWAKCCGSTLYFPMCVRVLAVWCRPLCMPVGDKWLIISRRWCSLFQRTRLSQQDTNYTHVIQSTICVSPSARFAACSLKGQVRVAKPCAVGTY